jgi:hypothetical protein
MKLHFTRSSDVFLRWGWKSFWFCVRRSVFGILLLLYCWVLTEKPVVSQLVKGFPAFHGTQGLVITTDRRRNQSWARWIHSPFSHPISLRSALILSSHLKLGLPRGLFPFDFLTEILCFFPVKCIHQMNQVDCVRIYRESCTDSRIGVVVAYFIWRRCLNCLSS